MGELSDLPDAQQRLLRRAAKAYPWRLLVVELDEAACDLDRAGLLTAYEDKGGSVGIVSVEITAAGRALISEPSNG